jgi:N-acetylneuraminic acid mutarotase
MTQIHPTIVRRLLLLLVLSAAARTANGHFVFIVPAADQKSAGVFLSEELKPDAEIKADLVAAAKLVVTDDAGHDTAVTLKPGDHGFTIGVPGKKTRVIHGVDSLGVTTRGNAGPFLLTYYPKTIIGDPFDPKTRLGAAAPVELVPTGVAGALKFLLLADGRSVSAAEITVIFPDGTDQKVTTDTAGEVGPFATPGRYGAWARHFTTVAGDRDGKHFDQTHDYATLVIDAPAPVSKTAFPPMPQKASSFGAVASGGYLYVYGGHVADTHEYSTASVSGNFSRLKLADPKQWEPLPGGPPLQGMNLAAHGGKIYRVGGMSPRNKDGEAEDVRSVADCAVFDPATGAWTPLPSLPEPRSSHDVAVVGDTLFVVGGWTLTGDSDAAKWLDTTLMMDLSADKPVWKTIPQPFQRRAMTAAAFQGKLYVIGGFQSESAASLAVDIYDPNTAAWNTGPDLPGPEINGFGPAGCADEETLYASVADGSFLALNKAGDGWDRISRTSPRIVHRMVPAGRQVLVLGGAAGQKQVDLIEAVDVKPAETPTTAPAAALR